MSTDIKIWAFQPIVGLYLIEVVLLMVYLINKVEYAGDNIYFMNMIKTLIISVTLYVVIVSITTLMFTGLAGVAAMVSAG